MTPEERLTELQQEWDRHQQELNRIYDQHQQNLRFAMWCYAALALAGALLVLFGE